MLDKTRRSLNLIPDGIALIRLRGRRNAGRHVGTNRIVVGSFLSASQLDSRFQLIARRPPQDRHCHRGCRRHCRSASLIRGDLNVNGLAEVGFGRPSAAFLVSLLVSCPRVNAKPTGRSTCSRALCSFVHSLHLRLSSCFLFSAWPFNTAQLKISFIFLFSRAILISLLFDVRLMNFYRHHCYSLVRH